MIGTRDMAFPALNMLSFWFAVLAAVIMAIGFFVPGGHAAAGWTGYAPLSADPQWTGVDWGQNLWAIGLLIQGFSSLVGSIKLYHDDYQYARTGNDVLPVTFGYLVTFHRRYPVATCFPRAVVRARASHL